MRKYPIPDSAEKLVGKTRLSNSGVGLDATRPSVITSAEGKVENPETVGQVSPFIVNGSDDKMHLSPEHAMRLKHSAQK